MQNYGNISSSLCCPRWAWMPLHCWICILVVGQVHREMDTWISRGIWVTKAREVRVKTDKSRKSREQSNSCLSACREGKAQHKDGLGHEGSRISAGMGMAASPGCPNHPKPAEKGQTRAQILQLKPRAVSLPCLCVNKPKHCSSWLRTSAKPSLAAEHKDNRISLGRSC